MAIVIQQSLTGFQQLGQFIDELLKRTGLYDDEEERDAYRLRLFDQITDRLGASALVKLSGKDVAEMAVRTEEGKLEGPEQILAFYEEKIPDFKSVMRDALIAYGKEFLETVQAVAAPSAAA